MSTNGGDGLGYHRSDLLRALAKTLAMWPVGRIPGGARLYHQVTCGVLGSQAFHAPKLARAWPRYAALIREHRGALDGCVVWVHECGWTPVSALAAYLLTGRAAILSNRDARVLDRYLVPALEAVLAMPLPEGVAGAARQARLRALAGRGSARQVVEALGGRVLEPVDTRRIPLGSGSVDFCHSGNALEHYRPDALRAFLGECRRVLRPGGIASHVVDHRDHLHHIDRRWPYLCHLAVPDRMYSWLFDHELLYHNRLSPNDMMALFDEVGFERIAVRRATADRAYASDEEVLAARPGLPRWAGYVPWAASARVRRWSELDRRTAYAHYVYRKPMDDRGRA